MVIETLFLTTFGLGCLTVTETLGFQGDLTPVCFLIQELSHISLGVKQGYT